MRIIFMGTPTFAVPILEALSSSGKDIVCVVTQPDRPQGRGLKLTASPVKESALRLGLPIYQPEKLRRRQNLAPLLAVPTDFIVTAAFGQLLPQQLLDHPRCAAINVHASLLPKYRGAAPIQRALMDGEHESGVTIMHMAAKLDAGDIILKEALSVDETMNFGTLHDALAVMGARLLLEAIDALAAGTAGRTPQSDEEATQAPMLEAADRMLIWNRSAKSLHDRIRALDPAPGAETQLMGKRLKVWRSRLVDEPMVCHETPGTVVSLPSDGPVIATGSGCIQLLELQPEGKKRLSAEAWLRGRPLNVGDRLGKED